MCLQHHAPTKKISNIFYVFQQSFMWSVKKKV